jgi:hypothetical protein
MKLPINLMVFVNVYIHFRIWTRIRNPRVTDPAKATLNKTMRPIQTPQKAKETQLMNIVEHAEEKLAGGAAAHFPF